MVDLYSRQSQGTLVIFLIVCIIIEALLTSTSLAQFIRGLSMPRASRAAAGGFCYTRFSWN